MHFSVEELWTHCLYPVHHQLWPLSISNAFFSNKMLRYLIPPLQILGNFTLVFCIRVLSILSRLCIYSRCLSCQGTFPNGILCWFRSWDLRKAYFKWIWRFLSFCLLQCTTPPKDAVQMLLVRARGGENTRKQVSKCKYNILRQKCMRCYSVYSPKGAVWVHVWVSEWVRAPYRHRWAYANHVTRSCTRWNARVQSMCQPCQTN